jgi:hypothetical protein
VSERHGCGLGKIRAGRKPRATAENCCGEHDYAMTDCTRERNATAANRRSSY